MFLDRIYFLDGFSNPFTAHFRPSFLFQLNFHFPVVVFFSSHAGITTLTLFFFSYFFDLIFLKMVFSIHS